MSRMEEVFISSPSAAQNLAPWLTPIFSAVSSMTLCFVPNYEGGRTFPSAGPDNHQQREGTDYAEQEKLNKSQWDLTQAFFNFTGRKEALHSTHPRSAIVMYSEILGVCGGKSAHYGFKQKSYYSITAWLTKVVGQD